MPLVTTIPAVAASGREGLDLSATRLAGVLAERLLLTVGEGAVVFELGPEKTFFFFAMGDARLEPSGARAGRPFVDAVAAWLGLELAGDGDAEEPAEPTTCEWVRLGAGPDVFGMQWTGFKIFLTQGERHAEVFLRLSDDRSRAQLLEKWSEYRTTLIEILERAVTEAPPRRVQKRAAPPSPERGLSFEAEAGVTLTVPEGFVFARQPEGHFRISDPEDEMCIELSSVRLPPLPPEAPDVPARVRAVVQNGTHAASSTPVASFARGDVTFAWSEYAWDSRDTKRPEAAPRPARGRTLVAANAWTQALVTGCWWVEDAARAEAAWDAVVGSLHLAGRLVDRPKPSGEA